MSRGDFVEKRENTLWWYSRCERKQIAGTIRELPAPSGLQGERNELFRQALIERAIVQRCALKQAALELVRAKLERTHALQGRELARAEVAQTEFTHFAGLREMLKGRGDFLGGARKSGR
jgi:hypothetical protein